MIISDSYAIALASLLEETDFPATLPLGNDYSVIIEDNPNGEWTPYYVWQVVVRNGGSNQIVATKRTQPMFLMSWTVVREMFQWAVEEMNGHLERKRMDGKSTR